MEDDPDRVRQYEHPKAAKHCGNVGRLQNGGRNQTGDSNGRQPERERERSGLTVFSVHIVKNFTKT